MMNTEEPSDKRGSNVIHHYNRDDIKSTAWVQANKEELPDRDFTAPLQYTLTWAVIGSISLQIMYAIPVGAAYVFALIFYFSLLAAILGWGWFRVDRGKYVVGIIAFLFGTVLYAGAHIWQNMTFSESTQRMNEIELHNYPPLH